MQIELVHKVLTEPLLMRAPLEELARRLREVAAQRPRFREEASLVLALETSRRQRYSSALSLSYSRAEVA
jgi:hypothetical protein